MEDAGEGVLPAGGRCLGDKVKPTLDSARDVEWQNSAQRVHRKHAHRRDRGPANGREFHGVSVLISSRTHRLFLLSERQVARGTLRRALESINDIEVAMWGSSGSLDITEGFEVFEANAELFLGHLHPQLVRASGVDSRAGCPDVWVLPPTVSISLDTQCRSLVGPVL